MKRHLKMNNSSMTLIRFFKIYILKYYLLPLVVVFLQFKICMRFPRYMYTDMVLLSTVAFVAIEQ